MIRIISIIPRHTTTFIYTKIISGGEWWRNKVSSTPKSLYISNLHD